MARHKCSLEDCDGTRLGHELARDFPAETRRVTEGLERLIDTGRAPWPLLCPECKSGKYLNCAGQALDPVTDEFVPREGGSS